MESGQRGRQGSSIAGGGMKYQVAEHHRYRPVPGQCRGRRHPGGAEGLRSARVPDQASRSGNYVVRAIRDRGHATLQTYGESRIESRARKLGRRGADLAQIALSGDRAPTLHQRNQRAD